MINTKNLSELWSSFGTREIVVAALSIALFVADPIAGFILLTCYTMYMIQKMRLYYDM